MIDREKFLEIRKRGESDQWTIRKIPWNKVVDLIRSQYHQKPFTVTELLKTCKAQGIEVSRLRLYHWLREQAGIEKKKHPKVLIELFAVRYLGSWVFYYTEDPEERKQLKGL